MTLLAASKITKNDEIRARIEAAIRKEGASKRDQPGAPGELARAGYTAPETVSAGFLLRAATNKAIADSACDSCGHSSIDDATLEWVVASSWDAVAATLYPSRAGVGDNV